MRLCGRGVCRAGGGGCKLQGEGKKDCALGGDSVKPPNGGGVGVGKGAQVTGLLLQLKAQTADSQSNKQRRLQTKQWYDKASSAIAWSKCLQPAGAFPA